MPKIGLFQAWYNITSNIATFPLQVSKKVV